jgi:hypothetical protein
MYYYEQNEFLKNEISIYFNSNLVASVNKNNFETDEDCINFCLFMVNSLNKNN